MIGLAEASIRIEAPQREVFDFFPTEQGLRSWMAKEVAVDLRPGGRWRWVHDNDFAVSGTYLEVEPYGRVMFTYGWESGPFADMGSGSTIVEVRFVPTDFGTEVTVTHTGVPEDFLQAHLAGWTYFLGLLAEVALGRDAPTTRLPEPSPHD
ncbi:MAG: SRPBCC family protein [Actinomycetota bacterium]|nr:SRPBCC family protein [Actinomycetota bacterium]